MAAKPLPAVLVPSREVPLSSRSAPIRQFEWRATRVGALASAVGGLLFAATGFYLKQVDLIHFHGIYPGVVASLVLMVVVSLRTQRNAEKAITRFFPTRGEGGAGKACDRTN